MSADVKGDPTKGYSKGISRNTKSDAGQYFTPGSVDPIDAWNGKQRQSVPILNCLTRRVHPSRLCLICARTRRI